MTSEIQQTEMLDLRRILPSLEYWRARPHRLPQRFYIAFCLLMSSVQDFVLGLKERETNNLNWSATCSYYSLVHGGRLICFLSLGDYPMQHKELGRFLSGSEPPRRQRHSYPFDWLKKFGEPNTSTEQADPLPNLLSMIEAYLSEMNVANAIPRLRAFGSTLRPACELRNDSTYEALLIAHEYRHQTISQAFATLSSAMSNLAESMLPFLIDSFNGFRRHDLDYSENRDEYETFLHVYVRDRIGNAIRAKIAGSRGLEVKLDSLLCAIATSPTDAPYEGLEQQVSLTLFEGKARLMNDFLNKINALVTATAASPGT